MKYTFHIVDVFSSTPFGGNQLAVLPDAAGISTEGMQKIAREFNFGETATGRPLFLVVAGNARDAELFQLRHRRGQRNLDFAASDVGRRTTTADRGHDASALTRLRFDFASARPCRPRRRHGCRPNRPLRRRPRNICGNGAAR
jgi:phenazine biosynthesis-like protein